MQKMAENVRNAEAGIDTITRQITSARSHIKISRKDFLDTLNALDLHRNVQILRLAVHHLLERAVTFNQLTSLSRKGKKVQVYA